MSDFIILPIAMLVLSIVLFIISIRKPNAESFNNNINYTPIENTFFNVINNQQQIESFDNMNFNYLDKAYEPYKTQIDHNIIINDKKEPEYYKQEPVYYKEEKINIDDQILISQNDPNNSFPMEKYDLDISEPRIVYKKIEPNEAFKDVRFERDPGVDKAMEDKINASKLEYIPLSNAYSKTIDRPVDSNDKLTFKLITDFSKSDLDSMYLADVFEEMSAKVNENISNDEINRIMGKPIVNNDLTGYYNPVFVSIDKDNLFSGKDDNNFNYKFQGYTPLSFGSLL